VVIVVDRTEIRYTATTVNARAPAAPALIPSVICNYPGRDHGMPLQGM
jgi:hypothetical protein